MFYSRYMYNRFQYLWNTHDVPGTFLGTEVGTVRKTDTTPALRKFHSGDPVQGQETMFRFRGKQSHFIYISSVPFHTMVAVLTKNCMTSKD